MKTCIVLSAIPGSGKSTWARHYQAEHPETYIVSSDDLREELYGSATNFKHEKELWDTYLNRLQGIAEKGDNVVAIADATNLQNKYRIFYNENTPQFDRHILVIFDLPYEECERQNKLRVGERVVPDYAMASLRKEFEQPSKEVYDLYDEVIIIKKYSSFPPSKNK